MKIGDRVTTPTGTGTIETIIPPTAQWAFRQHKPYKYGPYARIRYPRGRVDVWAFDKITPYKENA